MKKLKRQQNKLIKWFKFDPLNPVCGYDPRTGESHKWINEALWNKKQNNSWQKFAKGGFKKGKWYFLMAHYYEVFHYRCQRLYYIIKFRKLKIGIEDYHTY